MKRQLYNNEIKKQYLSTIREETRNFYEYVLSKAMSTEKPLEKDIYAFNAEELDGLIRSYSNRSIQIVQSVVSVLNGYIDWAIVQGLVPTLINFIKPLESKDLYKYLNLIAMGKKYLTEEELEDIIDSCNNSQDAVIFSLLFDSIKGENSEELCNLKVSDCNFDTNNLILTRNNGEKRKTTVSDRTMELIRDAIEEKEYKKNNGAETTAKSSSYPVVETEYVLRISARRNTISTINPASIIARINRIKNWYGNPYLTTTNIWYSGMIDMARKIKEDKKQLTKEDFENINEKFGYDKRYWYSTKVRVNEAIGE